MSANEQAIDDLEWEEWDGSSPFLHHCLAGSIAGIAEHTLMYPFDTVKTHMQSYCADCPIKANQTNNSHGGTGTNPTGAARSLLPKFKSTAVDVTKSSQPQVAQQQHGMWRTMRNLIYHGNGGGYNVPAIQQYQRHSTLILDNTANQAKDAISQQANAKASISRLFRGVQTMFVGCAPAHALYFSSYEAVKAMFIHASSSSNGEMQIHLSTAGSAAAGAAATICHDVVMTPLDTVKQRLQLGHYTGMADAMRNILSTEGYAGLYRSFPITLMTNVPYGMVMVSTNEFLKEKLNPEGGFDVQTSIIAGCGAGTLAAATTTPLDRVKTRLQTQKLGAIINATPQAEVCNGVPLGNECPKVKAERRLIETANRTAVRAEYAGFLDAFKSIVKEEGTAGLFRGLTPRLLTHAPAVAVSWTTYESAKKWLAINLDH